jgi:hypothetical protein
VLTQAATVQKPAKKKKDVTKGHASNYVATDPSHGGTQPARKGADRTNSILRKARHASQLRFHQKLMLCAACGRARIQHWFNRADITAVPQGGPVLTKKHCRRGLTLTCGCLGSNQRCVATASSCLPLCRHCRRHMIAPSAKPDTSRQKAPGGQRPGVVTLSLGALEGLACVGAWSQTTCVQLPDHTTCAIGW